MSTIHANTCIQTTTPLRNRWWFRWQCPVLVLRSCTSWNQGLSQRWLLLECSSAKYASAGYPLCFRDTTFFSKMGHKHIVHVTLSPCCRERRQSLSLPPPNSPDLNPVDYSIWGILHERVYRSRIHDVKELKERLLREWMLLDHTIITAATAQWYSRLNACVRVNGGHF